jgi:hypothetical protein
MAKSNLCHRLRIKRHEFDAVITDREHLGGVMLSELKVDLDGRPSLPLASWEWIRLETSVELEPLTIY